MQVVELKEKEISAVVGGVDIISTLIVGGALCKVFELIYDSYNKNELLGCISDLQCVKKLAINAGAKALWGGCTCRCSSWTGFSILVGKQIYC